MISQTILKPHFQIQAKKVHGSNRENSKNNQDQSFKIPHKLSMLKTYHRIQHRGMSIIAITNQFQLKE